jgi:hypothetical protein
MKVELTWVYLVNEEKEKIGVADYHTNPGRVHKDIHLRQDTGGQFAEVWSSITEDETTDDSIPGIGKKQQ